LEGGLTKIKTQMKTRMQGKEMLHTPLQFSPAKQTRVQRPPNPRDNVIHPRVHPKGVLSLSGTLQLKRQMACNNASTRLGVPHPPVMGTVYSQAIRLYG
jgi:hypothetical protein